MKLKILITPPLLLLLLFSSSFLFSAVESKCRSTCGLALASYYLENGTTLSVINQNLNSSLAPYDQVNFDAILRYNSNIKDKDRIQMGSRVLVPFPCECQLGDFLGHDFSYDVQQEDTYEKVATKRYANLTTVASLQGRNPFPAINIPLSATLNVLVNCSCGDERVSKNYGLFVTYPLRPEDSLNSIARSSGVPADVISRYNPGVDFSSGNGIVFVPGKDPSGAFPTFKPSKQAGGIGAGVIVGIVVGVILALLLVSFVVYYVYRKRKSKGGSFSSSIPLSSKADHASSTSLQSGGLGGTGVSPGVAAISVDKSVEFTLEELAKATDDFNLSFKIGQGGFGAVYYAELRGEKAAIKKMDMEASKQFLAELKVLTRVHHVNLVRLIGYCVEGSLFLVYEYVENGNLGQHLHGSGREPLPWTKRVQIALDSARGLEYIHEHTVPVYVHRDIKSANILIDQNFRAKVADFGLTKLTEVGGSATRGAMGTFGYMAPEIVYGEVSAKVDVYAFGVVLYELISAKGAVVKMTEAVGEFRGLVGVFEEVFKESDQEEAFRKIIDPRLRDNYPFDSVYKMAELGKACTQENPQLRPSMRYIVVALSTLFSSTGNWDAANFQNDDIVSLMSGR
ncbi:PREDICTED: chitin elicitor receptor kinase 1 isoform X1 [Camelina sativa]|uniref:Chitin elicitor receptor kinase 1 isoform X1 n=1 Tax=Camelina sativa TaxID=90675 RepID=A0ABM0XMM5_CAMSA|nr:PREDICTED: chitin elicitor receptor kinase 1 isoform X1 [Camelina sativa]